MVSPWVDALIPLVLGAVLVALVAAVPGFDFLLQMAGVAALAGTAAAYFVKRPDPRDAARIMRRHWKEIVALVILSVAAGALDARVGLSEDARFALAVAIVSLISLIAFRPSKLRKLR